MNNTITVICENTQNEICVNMGTSLNEILNIIGLKSEYPFIIAYVNNKFKELNYRLFKPATIHFLNTTHIEGARTYQRTLFFILNKAIHDIYPNSSLRIKHAVSRGFYCEIEELETIEQSDINKIKNRMNELIAQDIPIIRSEVQTDEIVKIYNQMHFDDKLELLHSRPRLYSTIYKLADIFGYFYGSLAPSTKTIHLFDLKKYYDGMYLAVPKLTNPNKLESMIRQDKMFDIFKEYATWGDVMGLSNIGSLNNKISCGEQSEMIKIAEAFHEKKVAIIADKIYDVHKSKGLKLILISGPSSSGKTTFSKRLGIQLTVLGLKPVLLSMDDYFVDRVNTPLDENGEYDFESIYSLDLVTFNKHLQQLLNGESVNIPRYDFIKGSRQSHDKPLQLNDRSVLVVEGIHGLNPELTAQIEDDSKFKIYTSALTSISMDNLSRISTSDNRLIRRIVRDYHTRNCNASETLKRWASVGHGERKHIFPYQENADIVFNSSLFYEISVLKKYVEPMLLEVPNTIPEYGEARRLLKFLENFRPIDAKEIPYASILREFIGESNF